MNSEFLKHTQNSSYIDYKIQISTYKNTNKPTKHKLIPLEVYLGFKSN